MDTIDLDAIIEDKAKKFAIGSLNRNKVGVKEATDASQLLLINCMREAIHQALVLASENATATIYGDETIVDKQSILDVEKLIKP